MILDGGRACVRTARRYFRVIVPSSENIPAFSASDVAPEMSVIIALGKHRPRGARALASVLDQEGSERIEVLLFDCGPGDAPPMARSDDPRVRYRRPGPGGLFAEVRAEGVRTSRAPIVTYLEEHCQAQAGWAKALLKAHREPWAAVGCGFISGNPGVGWSSPIYRLTYGCYLPPQDRGEVTWIAGHNSSYKRSVLLEFGERLPFLLIADSVMHEQIRAAGGRLFLEADAVIAHDNENELHLVAREFFWWNWCFGRIRATTADWGLARRLLHVALMPIQPWVRFARTLKSAAAAGPGRLMMCLRESWIIAYLHGCAAAGQACGMLFPMEHAERTFSYLEMNGQRARREELPR